MPWVVCTRHFLIIVRNTTYQNHRRQKNRNCAQNGKLRIFGLQVRIREDTGDVVSIRIWLVSSAFCQNRMSRFDKGPKAGVSSSHNYLSDYL